MKIRIVIPTYNGALITMQTIGSIKATYPDAEIVVVDNGSTDDLLATVKADDTLTVLHNEIMRAYARSVNIGANYPGIWDVLLVANNDVIFAPGAIEALCARACGQTELVLPFSPQDAQGAGVTPPVLRRPKSPADIVANIEAVATWWDSRNGPFLDHVRAVEHPYVPQGGYCFAISRALWKRLGGMDEGYELFGEDYDLFDRARRHTKLVQHCGAYVEHLEHQTVAWLGEERDVRMCRARFRLAEQRENLRELVSVVLPTFNRVEALFEAVDSVIRQTFPHWKLYVVDDGSKDWDRVQHEVSKRYRDHHARIWWFHRRHNGGPGAARNFGLDACAGKYVAFLDSDDIWYPDHLEKHFYLHERTPELLMSYSPTDFAWRWFDGGRYHYKRDQHPERQLADWTYSHERLIRECFIKTSTTVWWGELFRGAGALRFAVDPNHRDARGAVEDHLLFCQVADRNPYGIRLLDQATGRTHWAKNPQEEAHHSSRLIPWADYTTVPGDWLVETIIEAPEPLEGELLTVVIPTRERAEQLEACLDSLEGAPAIVVADGKHSAAYARELAEKRPRTGILTYSGSHGASYARNRGVQALRSEWAWFLDDDDLALPGWREILPYMREADAVIGRLIVAVKDGLRFAEGTYTSALFVRRSMFELVGGFDESSGWKEERDLVARLEAAGARVRRVGIPVAVKTTGPGVRATPGGPVAPAGRDPR